jgi:hypothetical protein
MLEIIKPPTPLPPADGRISVFFAGSIEMGRAIDWQAELQERLDTAVLPFALLIFNPRRDDWDATWEQASHHPQFREQVTWELNALEQAELIAMYFDPATQAPISLLELGLFAHAGKMGVCCPHGFWRKGNVDIVCERYAIPQLPTLPALADWVLEQAHILRHHQHEDGAETAE